LQSNCMRTNWIIKRKIKKNSLLKDNWRKILLSIQDLFPIDPQFKSIINIHSLPKITNLT
jgi:hypothetical protein